MKLMGNKKIFLCQDGTEFEITEKRYKCELYNQWGVWNIIPITQKDGEITHYQVKGLVSSEINSSDETCKAKGIITEINKKDVVSIVIKNPPNPKVSICFTGKDPQMKTSHIWEVHAVRSARKFVTVHGQRSDITVRENNNFSTVAQPKNIKAVDIQFNKFNQEPDVPFFKGESCESKSNEDLTVEIIASSEQGILIYIQSETINNNPQWKFFLDKNSLTFKGKWLNDSLIISPQPLSNFSPNVQKLPTDNTITETNKEQTPICRNCLHYQADICTNTRSPVFASKVNTHDKCPEFNCV
ncbi:MAG: hypothetical protein ACR9NN_24785 [Nostochopsis sp.]